MLHGIKEYNGMGKANWSPHSTPHTLQSVGHLESCACRGNGEMELALPTLHKVISVKYMKDKAY